MKKTILSLLVCSALLSTNIPVIAQNNAWREFYVSPDGSDSNPGTQAKPFLTLEAAQKAVREINKNMEGDIVVNIEEGTYYVDEMLDFGTADSGFNDHRVIWRGIGSDKPVISGGTPVSGFTDTDGDGIYTADLSDTDINSVHQLSVNGLRRHMAKTASMVNAVQNADGSYYYENPDVDYDGDYFDADSDDSGYERDYCYSDYDGLYISKRDFGKYENVEDILFAWNRGFYATYVPAYKIKDDPDNSDNLIVELYPGWWDALTEGSSSTQPKAETSFSIMNALELLDEPGEFYFDKTKKELHYMPVAGEKMATATVVVPKLETIVCIDGNDVDDKAQNITFTNLHFTDSKWDISYGFRIGQSIDISGNGQTSMAPSAILVMRADGIEFEDNIVSNTGANGINYFNAVSNSTVIGNAFYDIGVTAISSGSFNHNHGQLKSGTNANQSTAVPSSHADDYVDVVDEMATKTTFSSNYGVSHTPIFVADGHQHVWCNAVSTGAVRYPGMAGPDDGGWTKPGSPHKLNITWADYTLQGNDTSHNGYKGIWRSSPELEDTNSYVKFEFIRPYTIKQISLSFDSNYIAEGENANYEILVSNDPTFAEGTYKVWATQEEAALSGTTTAEINHYPGEDTTKYKYVMIRKTTDGALALSKVWVASDDRKPYVKNERCDSLTISNNVIDRVGVTGNHAVGIIVTSGDNHQITHNEVSHTGYTGISVGYVWGATLTCENMYVAYNHTYNTCRTSHDGGGIYTLGNQSGSVYTNNYIERSNQSIHGFYTDNGSSNMSVLNNYMDNTLTILSPYVGLQTWSNCPATCYMYQSTDGTIKLHKFMDSTNGWKTTWYYDSGDTENPHGEVYTGTDHKPIPKDSSIHDVVFRNNVGTHTYSHDYGKTCNDYEEPKQEAIGQATADSYDTLTNAGLEDSYKHLYDLIPENSDNMYVDYVYDETTYTHEFSTTGVGKIGTDDSMRNALRNTLMNGQFGSGLGMYPIEFKEKINNMLTYIEHTDNPSYISRYSIVQAFLDKMKYELNRYSIDETIELCEKLIEEARVDGSVGSYPQSAVDEAKASLATVKAMSESSAAEEYEKLIAAEAVYNTLEAAKYAAEIVSVTVPNAEKVEIDSITDTVTVYMPYGESLTVSDISIVTDENSMLYETITGEQNLEAGINVLVLCKGNGKFRSWTIQGVNNLDNTTTKLGANDWTAIADGERRISYGNGSAVLGGSPYAYIATSHANDEEVTLDFDLSSANDINELNLLFGVKSYENFDYDSTGSANNRFELDLDGDTAVLYSVIDGVKTELASGSSGINWDGENTLTYSMSQSGTYTTITVTLNGKTFTGSPKASFGRYMGIYTPYMNVKVY